MAKVPRTIQKHVNQRLQLITRRAERTDDNTLVDTFVSVGGVENIILNPENQIIFGRRGTGKTHALKYLQQKTHALGGPSLFLDMRQLGSEGSIYDDEKIDLGARIARVVVDFFSAIQELLIEEATRPGSSEILGKTIIELDALGHAISSVRVDESEDIEDEQHISSGSTSGAKFGAAGSAEGLKGTVQIRNERSNSSAKRTTITKKGHRRFKVHFSTLQLVFRNITRVTKKRLWMFIDEWSSLPIYIQPYLADVIRRVLFPLSDITVVIAAIEHRSVMQLSSGADYVGIEIGADCAVSINLDDFMVFENDPARAKSFFRALLFNHYRSKPLEGGDDSDFDSEHRLISGAFTQTKAFEELIRSCEGVPRDAINILSIAAAQANDAKITVGSVRKSAGKWFSQDKAQFFKEHRDAEFLLAWIADEVIGTRRSRAFLVEVSARNTLMDELYDGRMLHVLKRSVSAHDRPGVRYIAYKIDYGCYVELLATSKAPGGLLAGTDDHGHDAFIEVPPDDYRSIRRSILDLDQFSLESTKNKLTANLGRLGPRQSESFSDLLARILIVREAANDLTKKPPLE